MRDDNIMDGLDWIVLDHIKKGKIIPIAKPLTEELGKTVHYDIQEIRELAKKIYQLYSKRASREEFVKTLYAHRKKTEDDIHNFMSKLENLPKEELVEVLDRVDDGEKIVITLKKVSTEKKKALVKAITKKIVNKISKDQLTELFEQAINKLNDLKTLRKVNKALKKKKPKLQGSRGCYKLMIDDVDLFIVG